MHLSNPRNNYGKIIDIWHFGRYIAMWFHGRRIPSWNHTKGNTSFIFCSCGDFPKHLSVCYSVRKAHLSNFTSDWWSAYLNDSREIGIHRTAWDSQIRLAVYTSYEGKTFDLCGLFCEMIIIYIGPAWLKQVAQVVFREEVHILRWATSVKY